MHLHVEEQLALVVQECAHVPLLRQVVPAGQQNALPVEAIQIWLFGQHCPLMQLAVDGQWLPQLPQLLGSLLVLVQVPPHSVKPVGQAH